ncbi:MAG TPA: TrbC/VirB2 family protein [Thermoanaerobaculia bacterium]|nr:TrbC/VirB2 family protein [Thermoanaerobaculia bacterium]
MPERSSRPLRFVLTTLLLVGAALPARATSTGTLPWDNILGTIADSVQGPVLSALVIIGMCAAGAYWFFSESQRGLVQVVKVVIVAGVVSGLTAFLGAFGISMATL